MSPAGLARLATSGDSHTLTPRSHGHSLLLLLIHREALLLLLLLPLLLLSTLHHLLLLLLRVHHHGVPARRDVGSTRHDLRVALAKALLLALSFFLNFLHSLQDVGPGLGASPGFAPMIIGASYHRLSLLLLQLRLLWRPSLIGDCIVHGFLRGFVVVAVGAGVHASVHLSHSTSHHGSLLQPLL